VALFIRGCKISGGSCGGVTHFALTTDDDGGVMTVAWGQNASYGKQKKNLHDGFILNDDRKVTSALGPMNQKVPQNPLATSLSPGLRL
jgi:hypothetical protein